MATKMIGHLREILSVELPLQALFAGPTVSELARAVLAEKERQYGRSDSLKQTA